MTFDEFYDAYKPHKDKAAAIHFRITTHGDTDAENTHPFQVGTNLAFIHNGIISRVDRKQDLTRSDTYHFNTKYLSQFYRRDSRFIFKDHFKDLIKEYIGHSKLVFLNNKGHHTIVNEQMGHWDEGVWYSNNSYKKWALPVKKAQATTPNRSGVFTQGSRVIINHPRIHAKGTILHFTGGLQVGVLVDGDTQTSLFPMSCLSPYIEMPIKFSTNDWVVRVGDKNEDALGCVTGTSKDRVWVEWLNEPTAESVIEIVHESTIRACMFNS